MKYQTESDNIDDTYLINLANQAFTYLTTSDEYNAIDYLSGNSKIPDYDETWIREVYFKKEIDQDPDREGLLESYVDAAIDDFLEMYTLLAENLVELAPSKEALKLFSNYEIVKLWDDAQRTLVLEKKRAPIKVLENLDVVDDVEETDDTAE